MRKKALIITPYGLFNYGNRLQNYAVQDILMSHGWDSDTLLLRNVTWQTGWRDKVKPLIYNSLNLMPKARKHRAFKRFDSLISKYKVEQAKVENTSVSAYDAVVIGGDQIWNPHYVPQVPEVYGSFAEPGRRVCLAPSFGVSSLPEGTEGRVSEFLSSIIHLSVREESGRQLIKKMTGRDCPVLPDPVFGISLENWDNVASDALTPAGEYVFVYLLGAEKNRVSSTVRDVIERKGLAVAETMNLAYPAQYGAGPAEFIGLIRGSSMVVTDSFHACAFAAMYGRKLYVVEREGEAFSMSDRIATLTSCTGMDPSAEEELCPGLREMCYDRTATARLVDECRERVDTFVARALGEVSSL